MLKLRVAALTLALTGIATIAEAQPFKGVYLGAGAGYNLPRDVGVNGVAPTPNFQLQTGGGFVGLGAIGYGFGNGMRVELEGNYRNTTAKGATGGLAGSGGGMIDTYGAMVNALFDMDIGSAWLYPYIGGGLGVGWAKARNVSVTSGGLTTTSNTKADGRFAMQAIAGLAWPVRGMPGLSVTTEYRFFALMGESTATAVTTPGGAASTLKTQEQYNHSFLLGVRYAFGVTPPTPGAVATPAPAATRSYLVFFDWDKATLSDRARAVVKEAAEASTRVATTRIEVNGYTDTSGTSQYNQGLSIRRGQTVAAELVKNGVPRNAISIQGFGETRLLVATGDNAREAQNRWVEIILR
jgi:outer membrane protein OmpA-like peptidoglycan-associated protein